jgi:hypothetical protein
MHIFETGSYMNCSSICPHHMLTIRLHHGAATPTALIIVLLIVGRMYAATADADAAAVYNVEHSTARVGAIR